MGGSMRFNKTLVLISAVFFLTGCAASPRRTLDAEIKDLRRQVNSLSVLNQQKDEQIKEKERLASSLGEALDKEAKERAKLAQQLDVLTGKYNATPHASIKQIQVALRNAGYDPGTTDGLMGSRSRKAIRDFQKDNGLDITGKIDKAAWEKLKIYLHRKVK